jgi:hypothetical protein
MSAPVVRVNAIHERETAVEALVLQHEWHVLVWSHVKIGEGSEDASCFYR